MSQKWWGEPSIDFKYKTSFRNKLQIKQKKNVGWFFFSFSRRKCFFVVIQFYKNPDLPCYEEAYLITIIVFAYMGFTAHFWSRVRLGCDSRLSFSSRHLLWRKVRGILFFMYILFYVSFWELNLGISVTLYVLMFRRTALMDLFSIYVRNKPEKKQSQVVLYIWTQGRGTSEAFKDQPNAENTCYICKPVHSVPKTSTGT